MTDLRTLPMLASSLESARTLVRMVEVRDLPQIFLMNSDPEVTRYLGYTPWQTIARAEAWFERITRQQVEGSAREFVIELKETGQVIGRCGIFEHEAENAHVSLGYMLARSFWRQGYMSEALTALIGYAFREMALRRIETKIEGANVASIKLIESLGFTREGVLRERWITEGKPMNAEIHGMLREEWLQRAP